MTENERMILIVDDSPEDRATYRRYLLQDEQYTYAVLEEEYGENGLELCRLVRPDAILLDFLLPDIDGLEFLSELQTQIGRNDLPVIMLTGEGNEAIAVQAMKSGAADYLVKSNTTPESLRLAIHNVVEQAYLRRQLEQAEEALRESQHFIQRIANTSPNVLYLFDLAEQRNVYMNRQVAEVLGYTPEAVREMGTWLHKHLMHPDDFVRLPEHLKQLHSAQDGDIFEFEYRLKHVSGEWRWFCSRNAVFARTTDGLPYQIVGAAEDITERKQLLAREQAARAVAEAANRAKDDFLAMVSHDLRNPLTAILMYAQLLQARKLNDAAVARALATIESNAKLQAQLIEDLLDIARITSGKLRLSIHPIDLMCVIQTAIETVRLAAQAKEIQIETVLDYSSGRVSGDATRLQQVVWNLLSNAIKFTPKGGRIKVQLEQIDARVRVVVSDTGQGISAELLPYVFERFRQANNGRYGGLGLGLAIARHLLELHGGTIQAESPGEGQGATFTIELPVAVNSPTSYSP